MNIRNILIAGALFTMVPVIASAQVCSFVAGDTVLFERNASDERIMTFLNDMGSSRSPAEQRINVRLFSEQVAARIATQSDMMADVHPDCRTIPQLAEGFMLVNGLSGTLTDSQFAARVRTTGFKLPKTVVATQPPPPPAPPQTAAAAQASASVSAPAAPTPPPATTVTTTTVVDYQPQIVQLQRKLDALERRPQFTLSNDERAQLRNLPASIRQLQAAQAAAEEAKRSAEEQVSKATEQANLAITASTTAASAATSAQQNRDAAAGFASQAEASAKAVGKFGWVKWVALVASLIALAGVVYLMLTKASRKSVTVITETIGGTVELEKGWYKKLEKAPLNSDHRLIVLGSDGNGPLKKRNVVEVHKSTKDAVTISSGIEDRVGDSIKLAGLEVLVRQAGFKNTLNTQA